MTISLPTQLARLQAQAQALWPGATIDRNEWQEFVLRRWTYGLEGCLVSGRILGRTYREAGTYIAHLVRERRNREREANRVEKPKAKKQNPGKAFFADLARRKREHYL